MRFLTPLLVLFLCIPQFYGTGACGRAQNGVLPGQTFNFPARQTRTYAIPAHLIDRIIAEELDVADLPKLPLSYPGSLPDAKLPPGHYLRTTVYGDNVTYTYFSTYDYDLSISASNGKFQLRLYDSEGIACPDATVTADGKPVRYSEKNTAYQRRDWRINNLRIVVDSDTLFYGVRESIRRSRFGHDVRVLRSKEPFVLIQRPYYYGRSLVEVFTDGIGNGYWHWPRSYPLRNTIRRLTHPEPATGYVTTSQPRYRPADSLRVSAYLSFPKGRPVKADSVLMKINTYGRGQRKSFSTMIGRSEKGRYTHAMAFPPDWPLDQSYQVAFELPGILRRDVSPTIRFRLEDYELAEYDLSTTASTDARLPGSAWVDVRTEDVNGLALPNGNVKLTVITKAFVASREDSTITLADTLYVHTEATDNRKERRIILPDSIFPVGHSLKIEVVTQLTGPSGEFKKETEQLTVDRRYPVIPEMKIAGDSLRLFLTGAIDELSTQQRTATLYAISASGDTVRPTFLLPTAIKLDHNLSSYHLFYNPASPTTPAPPASLTAPASSPLSPGEGPGEREFQTKSLTLTNLSPISQSPTFWSRDTLLVSFPNPHAQPLRWTLFSNQKTLASGDQSTPPFIQSGFAPGTTLELHYAYLAGGTWQHERKTLTAPDYNLLTEHKNVLDLQLEQPTKVKPGETVRVALTATDQKGRPAANVRLSAGAFNAKFSKTPVKLPTYRTRKNRKRARQDYGEETYRLNRSQTPPNWLIKDLKLDTLLAYQLRYPDTEFTFQRDLDTLLPKGVETAHFAPFVIRKNKPVTVRTVYVDDRLAYWYHPNISTPYSIPVDSGWHEISLRTNRHEYKKKLHFTSCRQLVLSFDADRWVSAGWTREEKKEWSEQEVKRVHNRVFSLSNMTTDGVFTFRVKPKSMLQSAREANNGSWAPLGLATSRDDLDFWFPNGDSLELSFEPRATYRINYGRDRLYPLERSTVVWALKKSGANGPTAPGLPQYTYQPPPQPKRNLFTVTRLPRLVPLEPVSRIQFAKLPDSLGHVILAPAASETYYATNRTRPNRVKPGGYDVLYHFHNDSVFHQYVELGEDSITLLVFDRAAVVNYDVFDRRRGYSESRPAKEEPKVDYVERVFSGDRVSGVIVDEKGEKLIGTSILIKGTRTGTVTGMDGEFDLAVPDGDFELVISYIGFDTRTLTFNNMHFPVSPLGITLEESSEKLDQVVVTAYGISRIKVDRTTSGQVITAEQMRNLPTRNINQIASIAAGVSVSDEQKGISIRGSRSNVGVYYVDGVRVQSSEIPDSEIAYSDGRTGEISDNNLPAIDIRESFSDYAAFIPDLRTDRAGKAVFDVTFPDDITAWSTFVVGQDRRRRIGFALERTTAFLPFQAQLYLPRFLVEGDQSEAATLAVNREDGEREVRLTFTDEANGARTQDAMLGTATEERYPISVPFGADSLTYQFTVQTLAGEPAADGERRTLPVYPRGTEMVSGELLLLTDETTALPQEFIRPDHGPVTLRLPGNRVQQLLNDLDHIVDYPYACTEQTASRLIGLLQLKNIRSAQQSPFEREGKITRMIARLEKLRRPDGGFGWWAASSYSSSWISLHVYRALSAAADAGYNVKDLTGVRRYLLGKVPELPVRDQLQILLVMAEAGFPSTASELKRLRPIYEPTTYEILATARLRQLRGDTVNIQRIMDSSATHAALGRYWGERGHFFYRQPLGNRLACSLLAHRILTDAGETKAASETINYLLGQTAARNRPGNVPLLGTNTLESARLLSGLLPSLLAEDDALAPPAVTLRNDGTDRLIDTFPFETEVAANAITDLRLTRTGTGPLPVSIYQRWFETEPSAKDDGFLLKTELVDARDRPLTKLTQGTTAYLHVTVTTTADTDYVLIEVPIPAGCSYGDRTEKKGPFAVHREYRRDRVAIFCDRLPTGTYTYRVELEPRFSGEYTLNPARAEMQYLPTTNGNDQLRRVTID